LQFRPTPFNSGRRVYLIRPALPPSVLVHFLIGSASTQERNGGFARFTGIQRMDPELTLLQTQMRPGQWGLGLHSTRCIKRTSNYYCSVARFNKAPPLSIMLRRKWAFRIANGWNFRAKFAQAMAACGKFLFDIMAGPKSLHGTPIFMTCKNL